MSFLIRVAPFLVIVSWAFFRSLRNLVADFFLSFDFKRSLIAFWRRGSVGRTLRIFFAEDFVGIRRRASIPALATFSAPWIFTDFMLFRILLNFWLEFFI